jgi:hypothetical protein
MAASLDSSSPPYVYKPPKTPKEQICLLTIMPNRDKRSVIEASLSIHRIPMSNARRASRLRAHLQLPWYLAVSYVWGEGATLEGTREIILDGCRYPVTANVHSALHGYLFFMSIPLNLWIDSICIDQENHVEKNGQISIMREIYHISTLVNISLGPGRDEDRRMMRFCLDPTQHPLWNKLVDKFLDLYTPA